MKKIKLVSISKSEFRSEYVFKKEQKFFDTLRGVLKDLGFDEFNIRIVGRPFNEKLGDYVFSKEEHIKNYIDRIDKYHNNEYSVDVIYFTQKIHVIINSREDKQQEIAEKLEKYIDF